MLTATAVVETSASARYAKQLASHLGRRATVVDEPQGQRILIGEGSCLLSPGDALVLEAVAPDADALERVKDVVGSHLVRFGQRNELVVTWA